MNLESLPCAILMAIAAILLIVRLKEPIARTVWSVLLVLGMAHAVGMGLLPENLLNRNVVHYYLGAKYDFPYRSFYELTSAATDRPQIFMHDLDRPPAIIRDEPSEQRAYFIDLLRAEQIPFDPLIPLADLQRLAEESGAVHREAQRILNESLPPDQIESFCRDTKAALITENPARDIEGIGNDITLDFGYNGSPLYTLVRHLDPTLYLPFGRATALLNLVWQVLGSLALFWLVGIALGLGTKDRIAIAALFFASWDYVAWNLPGLSFAGFWLPIALALWAISRSRPIAGGIAIAWAGLIKLFPFGLLFYPAVEIIRAAWGRLRRSAPPSSEWRWSATLIAATLLAALALGGISEFSGRSWASFLVKILQQFGSDDYVGGNVSVGQALIPLGIYKSPIAVLIRLLALAAMTWFLWKSDSTESRPRTMLIVLAAMPWFVSFWFNYYTMAPLILLPLVAKKNRLGAAICTAFLALTFLLPEFGSPTVTGNKLIWMAKILPYLAVPAWLVFVEFRPLFAARTVRRWAIVLSAAVVVIVCGEAFRQSMIRQYDTDGGRYLDQGRAQTALGCYDSLLGIAPGNAMAHMSRGICLADLGQYDEAETSFRRASELAPDQPHTFLNLAYLLSMRGRLLEAQAEIEKAVALAPCDDAVWVVRAHIAADLGDRAGADSMLTRALELNPQNGEAQAMLRSSP
jgi:tetratricopeptide (TPR) repeat protein